jgi:hypothetical protein
MLTGSEFGNKITTQATPALSVGREAQFDGRPRIRFHRVPTLSFLRGTVLSWFHAVGVLPVLCEIRSCYQRILLRRRIGSSLSPQGVRQSLLPIGTTSDSPNQIETPPYIRGIQALSRERPWLTLPDIELFLQGWLRAEVCANGNAGTAKCTSAALMDSQLPPSQDSSSVRDQT